MYFVSDGEDGHVFSRTAREHEAAVQRFRKVRAQQRRQDGR
jgi:cell division protein YceG involved in septum cleavage